MKVASIQPQLGSSLAQLLGKYFKGTVPIFPEGRQHPTPAWQPAQVPGEYSLKGQYLDYLKVASIHPQLDSSLA
jgi:hypothetical protein